MNYYILFNVLCLLVCNLILLTAGTLFNIVVVLSIWKSSQLRKKLCNFMIFILSCIDLFTVIVLHPLIIFWCIIWHLKGTSWVNNYSSSSILIGTTLNCWSITVLFLMTLERYIGLTRPFFHKTFVTKRRLVTIFVTCQFVVFPAGVSSTVLEIPLLSESLVVLFLAASVWLVILMNYKMFAIARSKTRKKLPCKGKIITQFKPYYTCALAVACFLLCCSPIAIYHVLSMVKSVNGKSDVGTAFFLWSSSIMTMNSTINSVIFFWMNNVLNCEGKKLLQRAVRFLKF